MIAGLAQRVEGWLARTSASTVRPSLHAAWRILFGILALDMSLKVVPLQFFLWWHKTATWMTIGPALTYIWVALTVLIILGLGGRWMLVAHLLVASTVLEFEITGPRNVEESLYLISSTWLVFAGTGSRYALDAWWRRRRGRPVVPAPGWPMRLMAINVAMILFYGGITKLFDPLWRYGMGFYYSMLLPWVTVDTFDALLDHRWLMIFMNYAGLAFEISLLGLVLFRWTQPIAWALTAFFFASIAYPFQLGYIGPIGLTIVLGMASARIPVARPATAPRTLMLVMLGYMTLFFAIGLGKYVFRYPMLYSPTVVVEDDGTTHLPADRPSLLELTRGALPPALRPTVDAFAYVNEHMIKVNPLVLFNAVHSVGLWLPRFELVLDDGTVIEPVHLRLVDHDLSAGPSTCCLTPRIIMIIGYWTGDITNRVIADPDYRPSPYEAMWIRSTFEFAIDHLTPAQREQLAWVSWHVRPVVMPDTFVGNTQADRAPWVELFRFEPEVDDYRIFERPAAYPSRPIVHGFDRPARIEIQPGPAPPALGDLPRR